MGLSNKDAHECADIVDLYLKRFKETYGTKPKLSDLANRLEKELAARKEVDFKATFGDLTAQSLEHCLNMIKACAIAEDNALKPALADEGLSFVPFDSKTPMTMPEVKSSKPKAKWNPLK